MVQIGTSNHLFKIVEYLLDPAMHQLGYMFCFTIVVKDLRKLKGIPALALNCIQNDVERARRDAEDMEDDVDANRILADAQSRGNEVEESKGCSNPCTSGGCRYWLIRKAAKMPFSLIKHQKTYEFERVDQLTSFPGIVFFLVGDFICSTFAFQSNSGSLGGDDEFGERT